MVDLDAIKAMWRGFDAPLSAAYDEDAEEWVITSADDGSPYTGVLARMECDYAEHAEQLGTLWGGAGPQVAALVAEVERLRAIVEGRTTAPTPQELAAHPGRWLMTFSTGDVSTSTSPVALRLRRYERHDPRRPVRWWPLDPDGRPRAWPEVARG